ncbi:MAG: flagellar assembly peptidoglycan hydrolase FlgJ [Bradyrhizobium sp.]|nr:flagellar assembly peptidoglycan hydrolase FlgJ [Bradyrhizobium sp.]
MQSGFITTAEGRVPASFATASIAPRADLELQDALKKVSPAAQAKAKSTATDFEAMFLNSMFSEMTSGLKGEGPFGDTPGTGVWRSMLTEQYSKNFAKAGGVGISSEVFRTLILQQAKTDQAKADQAKTYQIKTYRTKTSSEMRTPT